MYGTSVKMLQDMACGTPVIASETPGYLDWIEDEVTGQTFPMATSNGSLMCSPVYSRPTPLRSPCERGRLWSEMPTGTSLARLGNALRL